jgi:hypothetical protein
VGTVAPWLLAVVDTVAVTVAGVTGAPVGVLMVAVDVVVPGVEGGATLIVSPLNAVTVTVTVCPWAFVAVCVTLAIV